MQRTASPRGSRTVAKAKPAAVIETLADLTPDPRNARRHNPRNVGMLEKALGEVGAARSIVIDEHGVVLAGNATIEAAARAGIEKVQVVDADGETIIAVRRKGLTAKQKTRLALYDNRTAELADWDADVIADLLATERELLDGLFADEELAELLDDLGEPETTDAEPQMDRAAELNKKWQVQAGDLWRIGEHRLLCGDSTKREDVERVMGGEKAQLIHADPPYGMGKEKEGVENDNLYADKLDAFQMSWWQAFRPHIEDNGSVYIWGNAESLWRLWYVGGLKNSERLTFRNEILWDQVTGVSWGKDGMAGLRKYAPMGERCLFFMLGEQGFNNNADNYWQGWEPVRAALAADCKKMEWGPADIKRICGVGMFSHWFTESQWTFIPEEHYKKLQAAARDHDAFKRDHDELKREFYATRAYFDNTHDNMTDVWAFPRVTGQDRHDHATPKPVAMICRAIKSSTADRAIVVEPFLGSGTTMVACENLQRKCRGIEISADYCAVILERMATAFPALAIERA